MWELDREESWVQKNWSFWTVVLEKTLEIYLDTRRSNQSIIKEMSPWCSLEGLVLNLKLKTLATWYEQLAHWKDPDAGKDWKQEKGMTEDEMVGCHHWHNGHEFEWTPGVGNGQGGLTCRGSWGGKESDTTELLNWTDFQSFHIYPVSVIRKVFYSVYNRKI